MSNELFVLPEQLKQAVMGSDPTVVCSLISDMQKCGIFRLPYDKVDVKFVNDGTTMLIKNLCLTDQVVDPQDLFTPDVKTPAFTAGEVAFSTFVALNLSHDPEERQCQAHAYCDVAAIVLIIALATSNIDKRTSANKRAQLGIGKSANKPYRHITYLNLPRARAEGSGGHGSNEHSSPRMHLRRGHSREQHFGRGNLQTRRIWIAPTFVNADDTYVPREKYHAQIGNNL